MPVFGPVLGIDSASAACSAAVVSEGCVLSREYREMTRGHAEVLVPMVQDAMAAAGCGFSDLALLAATVGPGSYTGLRVCLAAARSMALAAGLPLAGVTTLEAVAAAQPVSDTPLLVALGTGRKDVYVQPYASLAGDLRLSGEACAPRTPLCAPEALMPEGVPVWFPASLRPTCLVAGDAGERVLAVLRQTGHSAEAAPGPRLPDAAVVAQLAAGRYDSDARSGKAHSGDTFAGDALLGPEPLYLRPPDVTLRSG